MGLVEKISDMTIRIEQGEETRQEVYDLLLLALIEIRQLTHRIAVLESKVLNQ